MARKYKIKKRKKIVNPYLIFLALAVSLIFVSSGYAFLTDNLKINGTVSFGKISEDSGEYEYGNSTYSYNLVSTWPSESGGKAYQIELPVTNLDGDIVSWEISFDVPDGYSSTSDIWQAQSITYSDNTVTIKSYEWNGKLDDGATMIFNFILHFESEVDFKITNLSLNGKYANLVEYQRR